MTNDEWFAAVRDGSVILRRFFRDKQDEIGKRDVAKSGIGLWLKGGGDALRGAGGFQRENPGARTVNPTQQFLELGTGDWLAQEVALECIAAFVAEESSCSCVSTPSAMTEVKAMGHGDDGGDDGRVVDVCRSCRERMSDRS